MAWDPRQYERFCDQRRRPALDLFHAALGKLERPPARVVDLGCGGGELAGRCAEAFPEAEVTGVDSSAPMLERARAGGARVRWLEADIATWRPESPVELILSNAALHWLPDHDSLFPRLMESLAPGGVLAVQMPRNFEAPSHVQLRAAANEGPWAARLKGALAESPVHDPARYHDWLAPLARTLDFWETTYLHILTGADPVLEWTKGTAMRPVLDRLDEIEAALFMADYGSRLRLAYPPRPDGVTLFPFRRLFLVARR